VSAEVLKQPPTRAECLLQDDFPCRTHFDRESDVLASSFGGKLLFELSHAFGRKSMQRGRPVRWFPGRMGRFHDTISPATILGA